MAIMKPVPAVAFRVLHAALGITRLVKRSPTLDGSLPLRAARHCPPVVEGNAAGFQIVLTEPFRLRATRDGPSVDLEPGLHHATHDVAAAAVARLVSDGLLRKNGLWHRTFATSAFALRGAKLLLWTGFLVRPEPGVWLRVTRPFNRGSRVRIVEHLVDDGSAYTPLVLEISPHGHQRFEGEIGCVLPVASTFGLSLSPLRASATTAERTSVAASFDRFFDASYFEAKERGPTGKYQRQIRATASSPAPHTCAAEALFAGPDVHAVRTLDRFFAPTGIASRGADGQRGIAIGVVRNVARVRAHWDGQAFTRQEGGVDGMRGALARTWKRAGGDPSGAAFDFLRGYVFAPSLDEPYWLVQPWVFATTSPGWSMVLDGVSHGAIGGMRGVIQTDVFHALSMVYRLYEPGPIALPRGAPLLTFHPVPRRLLDATFEMQTL